MKPSIAPKVVVAGNVSVINTYYRSLMALIKDRLYPGCFGECGGMERCATCQIVLESRLVTEGMERNEQATLEKLGISDPAIRLSCQLLVES